MTRQILPVKQHFGSRAHQLSRHIGFQQKLAIFRASIFQRLFSMSPPTQPNIDVIEIVSDQEFQPVAVNEDGIRSLIW
jgi:hypothetical protein